MNNIEKHAPHRDVIDWSNTRFAQTKHDLKIFCDRRMITYGEFEHIIDNRLVPALQEYCSEPTSYEMLGSASCWAVLLLLDWVASRPEHQPTQGEEAGYWYVDSEAAVKRWDIRALHAYLAHHAGESFANGESHALTCVGGALASVAARQNGDWQGNRRRVRIDALGDDEPLMEKADTLSCLLEYAGVRPLADAVLKLRPPKVREWSNTEAVQRRHDRNDKAVKKWASKARALADAVPKPRLSPSMQFPTSAQSAASSSTLPVDPDADTEEEEDADEDEDDFLAMMDASMEWAPSPASAPAAPTAAEEEEEDDDDEWDDPIEMETLPMPQPSSQPPSQPPKPAKKKRKLAELTPEQFIAQARKRRAIQEERAAIEQRKAERTALALENKRAKIEDRLVREARKEDERLEREAAEARERAAKAQQRKEQAQQREEAAQAAADAKAKAKHEMATLRLAKAHASRGGLKRLMIVPSDTGTTFKIVLPNTCKHAQDFSVVRLRLRGFK